MRVSIAWTSANVPTVIRLVTGSRTVTDGLKSATMLVHRDQMRLEAVARRAVGVKLQQAGGHPGLEVDADGPHVPQELLRGFLEQEAQAAFAAAAGGIEEVGREARLAGAGGAGDEYRAATIVACAAEHFVEPRDAGRHPVHRRLVLKRQRRDGQHTDAVGVDEEWILVRAVMRAAVLDDAQPARRDLIVNAVVEEDHRIRDVLLEALAGQRALAALAGDHGGHALVLQPAEEPPQFGAEDPVVGEAGEQRLDRVEDDALGADRLESRGPERTNSPSRS